MRVATTKTGYVGMVPQQTRAGDIIVVIKGVSVPMVVRRAKAEEESFILGWSGVSGGIYAGRGIYQQVWI
jgi:hypothetical protein